MGTFLRIDWLAGAAAAAKLVRTLQDILHGMAQSLSFGAPELLPTVPSLITAGPEPMVQGQTPSQTVLDTKLGLGLPPKCMSRGDEILLAFIAHCLQCAPKAACRKLISTLHTHYRGAWRTQRGGAGVRSWGW